MQRLQNKYYETNLWKTLREIRTAIRSKGRKGDRSFKNLCAISLHLINEEPHPYSRCCLENVEARGEILYGRSVQHLSVKFFWDQKCRFVLPERFNEFISFSFNWSFNGKKTRGKKKKIFCFDIFQMKLSKFSIKLFIFKFPSSHLFFWREKNKCICFKIIVTAKSCFKSSWIHYYNGLKKKKLFFNSANFF